MFEVGATRFRSVCARNDERVRKLDVFFIVSSKVRHLLLARNNHRSIQRRVEEQERFERLFEEMDTLAITYEKRRNLSMVGIIVVVQRRQKKRKKMSMNNDNSNWIKRSSLLQFDDFEADDEEPLPRRHHRSVQIRF